MWKRINRQPERSIGGPVHVEPTVDEHTIESTTNLNNGDFSISSRPAFGRKKTEDVLKGLPDIPFKSLPIPQTPDKKPVSNIPENSAIYSQHSPETNALQMPKLEIPPSSSVYPHDISPVESSEGIQRTHRSSSDVSPITDPQSAPAEHNYHTDISKRGQVFGGAGTLFPRKTRPFALNSTDPDSPSTNLTRWDDFSGERTASEKGKPASTSPGAVRLDVEAKYGRRQDSLGNSVMISGPKTTGLRKISGARSSPWIPPGWKGAGGRHPIVNVMLDKPLPPGETPTFPAGSHQRSASREQEKDRAMPRAASKEQGKDRAMPRTARGLESPPLSESTRQIQSANDEHCASNSRPECSSDKGPPQMVTTRPSQQPTPPADSPSSGLTPDDIRSPLARNPSNEEFRQELPPIPLNISRPSDPTSVIYKVKARPIKSEPATNHQRFNIDDHPPSRFSTTTFATTIYDSPPATPEIHQDGTMQSPTASILDRKRPVPVAGVTLNTKVTARKPIPSQVSTTKKAEESSRHSKSLPKEPPEEPKISRVESLQAKLDALRRRRGNLQTVIHELTNVVQPSSIAYDMASRQEIKRTVEGLGKELAEVVKEEHETGLKLHRAYKRHDDTAYEPTHLWVRRVTS